MKLKNILKLSSLFLLLFTVKSWSQTTSTEFNKLQRVYESLEYNTIAFNDLKQKWIISDPLLVREIYNRFVVRNALRIGGNNITLEVLKAKTNFVYEGKIVIDLRKRYYDDEVEFFAFVPEKELQSTNPNYLFDPIKDGFLLRDIVGDKVYDKIKSQGYFYSSLTKTNYDTKNGYFYDIYLNALEPHVTYWNTTSAARNKYQLYAFGKWGSDRVMLPGWYSGEYIVGSGLTYYQSISNDLRKYLYDIRFGTAMESGIPFRGGIQLQDRLHVTGQSVYARISGDVLKFLIGGADGYILSLEAKYSLNEYKVRDFNISPADTIFSVRDYAALSLRVPDLADLGDLGVLEATGGVATSDIYRYQALTGKNSLIDLDLNKNFVAKFTHNVFLELGLSRTGGLIQHDVSTLLTYNTNGFGVIGIKGQVMLSDQFGFDVRVMKSFGLDKYKEPWRTDSYIVFSPILRINY